MDHESRLAISAALRRTVADLGSEAERWLARAPALVAEASDAWGIEVGHLLPYEGHASITFAATTHDGREAVLKLSVPHYESRHEADALRRWDGNGTMTLLRSSDEGFTLLLERCEPGHDLWRLPLDDQVEVMADLLPRLWVSAEPGDPFEELDHTAARWEQQMLSKARVIGVPVEVAERARRWARELRETLPRTLLHGDFHPGNVLAAEQGRWLAIDPKPWVGDPAFDLAQALTNWIDAEPEGAAGTVELTRRRARQLSDRLSLDVDRVLRWAVVKAIGWDFGRDTTLILDRAARTRDR